MQDHFTVFKPALHICGFVRPPAVSVWVRPAANQPSANRRLMSATAGWYSGKNSDFSEEQDSIREPPARMPALTQRLSRPLRAAAKAGDMWSTGARSGTRWHSAQITPSWSHGSRRAVLPRKRAERHRAGQRRADPLSRGRESAGDTQVLLIFDWRVAAASVSKIAYMCDLRQKRRGRPFCIDRIGGTTMG